MKTPIHLILSCLLPSLPVSASVTPDPAHTVMAVVSDSLGYDWPELFTNLPPWRGLKAFTNATMGGTPFFGDLATCGTNILYNYVLPFVESNAVAGDKVLLFFGHGTIDQINGIANVGGITNYLNILSNLCVDLRRRAQTNDWNLIIVRPTMVLAGASVSPDDYALWVNNNWLARPPTNNLVDYVPDFYRLLPDNTDTNWWDADEVHAAASNPLRADLLDRTLRGKAPSRPAPLDAERSGRGWQWRNTSDGSLAALLYPSGVFRAVMGAPYGEFPASTSLENVGGQFTGMPDTPGLSVVGQSNQTSPVIVVQPYNASSTISMWDSGVIKAVRFDGAVLVPHERTLEFTNSNNRYFDFLLSSTGTLEYRDLLNQSWQGVAAPIFSISPIAGPGCPRVHTSGSYSADHGYYRSNIVSATSDVTLTAGEDVVRVESDSIVMLPTGTEFKGKQFTIISLTATALVAKATGQLIQGIDEHFPLEFGESVSVLSDGTNWLITSWYSPRAKAASQ